MRDWYIQNLNWQGTAAELAELTQSLLTQASLKDESIRLSERLARNYMQLGILGRPAHSGKEAHFGASQVIEFLVARKLIQEGWPLAKIAEFNRTHELEDLMALFPDPVEVTDAEKLVAKLRLESQLLKKQPSAQSPSPPPSPSSFLAHSADWSRRKSSAKDTLRLMGNPSGEATRSRLLKISITDWCEIFVDPEQLRKLPIESLDALGNTIAHLLREELQSTRRS